VPKAKPTAGANSESVREQAESIPKSVDSFAPAHSAFDLSIYVGAFAAGSVRSSVSQLVFVRLSLNT
jgi:hypothetical protein